MKYEEMIQPARENMGDKCRVCLECNGIACKNTMPGPGAAGIGDNATRNYLKWKDIRVNMDTIHENYIPDTSIELFGRTFRYPFFAGPLGSISIMYGGKYADKKYDGYYNDVLVNTCAEEGIAMFVGDGPNPDALIEGAESIKKAGGIGVSMLKPWDKATILEKLAYIRKGDPLAVCMDVDGAGLPVLKQKNEGFKSVEELKEIISMGGKPFIVKGIMTPRGAMKAVEAGAYGIVVSNHGGRVLDQCPATAEVLGDIVDAVQGRAKVFVDGGIRSGVDIFKALALGADAVLICRPFVTAFYGGEAEGVSCLIQKYADELKDTMKMCGAASISEISRDMIWKGKK